MKTSVLLLGCLLATASLAQSSTRREVWAWKDADGVTHYSDYPAPGAHKIVIVGSVATQTTTTAAATAAAPIAGKPAAAASVAYDRLDIWSPENGATFFGADAPVNVRIRSEPALAPGDRLLTYLDGKLVPGENAYEHTLSEIERGAHSVTSVIVDAKGNEKIRSAPVVFHVRQPGTVDNPRNQGPTLRPPAPKPGG